MTWQAAHPGFVRIAWLMPLALTLLEAEEWNWDIFSYCHARFPSVPIPSAAHAAVVMFVVVLIFWLWTCAALRARTAQRAAFAILPLALIGFERVLLLPYWVVHTSAYAYAPGMVTTFILLGPASFALVRRACRDGLVSRRYLVTLAAILMLDVGNWVIRVEAALTEKMLAIDRYGTALEHLVGR